jgi:hypothetical protein
VELIFLIIVVWAVAAFLLQSSPGKVVQDPDRLRDRLRSLARSGKDDKSLKLLQELPSWPIRDWLISAAIRLAELRHGVELAVPTGVPTEATSAIREHVERHQEAVWAIAVRVAAIAQQTGAPKLKKLPPEVLQWLSRDEEALRRINEAAYETNQSLTVAMAKGERQHELQQQDMTTELRALSNAVRKLSNLQ